MSIVDESGKPLYTDVTADELRKMAFEFARTTRDVAMQMARSGVQGGEPLADYMGLLSSKLVQLAYLFPDDFKLQGDEVGPKLERASDEVIAYLRAMEVETPDGTCEIPTNAVVH